MAAWDKNSANSPDRSSLGLRRSITVPTAGDFLSLVQVLAAYRVIAKADGIELLEPLPDVLLGCRVIAWGNVQRFAKMLLADITLLNEDAAGLDDVAGQGKHRFLVLVRRVDRDICVGAGAEVPLMFQA